MDRVAILARRWILPSVAIVLLSVLAMISHSRHSRPVPASLPSLPAAFASQVPARVLWAWEEPEDLHTLPPSIGIGYLAETDILTDHIAVLPRRQPLSPAPGAPLIAVVRIETRPGFADTSELRAALAAHLAAYATRRDISAIQLDFDATQSQHGFYRGVLEALRPQLPHSMPLSITALVSWCGPHSWLHTLPIDEAVPMEFRMGGPRALAMTAATRTIHLSYPITESLCRTSLGLSTDEPWPASISLLNPATRVYLFAPHPWRPAELTAVSNKPFSSLAPELSR